MKLPMEFDVQLQRVPAHATSNKQPGKVHLVLAGTTLHDLAQNTNGKRWPWDHATERVTHEEWSMTPCLVCQAALDGKTLPGRV